MTTEYQGIALWLVSEKLFYCGTTVASASISGNKLIMALDGSSFPLYTTNSAKTYSGIVLEDFVGRDWGGAVGSTCRFIGNNLGLQMVRVSATKYTVDLLSGASVIYTGTTQLTFGTAYDFRGRADGVTAYYDIGVANGAMTQEGSGATALNWQEPILRTENVNAAVNIDFGRFVCYKADSFAEQAATALSGVLMVPDAISTDGTRGQAGKHNEFDQAGSGATPHPDYTNVDDWGTGASDGNTTNDTSDLITSPTVEKQAYTTANQTLSNIRGVQMIARIRGGFASKNINCQALMFDGTTDLLGAATAVTGTGYDQRVLASGLAPSGSPWTQTDLDNLEIGVRIEATSGTGDTVGITAVAAEAVGYALDPVTPGLPNLGTPPQGVPARPIDREVINRRTSYMYAPEGGAIRQLHEIERDFEKSKRALVEV